jgi:hypothetical protein
LFKHALVQDAAYGTLLRDLSCGCRQKFCNSDKCLLLVWTEESIPLLVSLAHAWLCRGVDALDWHYGHLGSPLIADRSSPVPIALLTLIGTGNRTALSRLRRKLLDTLVGPNDHVQQA